MHAGRRAGTHLCETRGKAFVESPVARAGVVGYPMVGTLEFVDRPDQFARRAPAMDLDAVVLRAAGDVKAHRRARGDTELVAVGLDRVVAGDVVGHRRSP